MKDHSITPALSIKFAKIAKAKLIIMDSEPGHLIFGEKILIEVTRKFLSK